MQARANTDALSALSEANILVIEDNVFIQLELEAILSDAGVRAVNSYGSVASALKAIAAETPAAAILDVHLGEESVAPLARELSALGVPFMFYTGQLDTDVVLNEWAKSTVLSKPAPACKIIEVLTTLIGSSGR